MAVKKSLRFLKQFGLPLQVFASQPETEGATTEHTKGVALYPLFALPEVDKLDNEKGFMLGTTNQLFLNFPKIKADIIVDLDKFTIQTMTEIKQASNQKQSASNAIAPEAVELQKIIKNHTSYEKKVFKIATSFKPKKQQPQQPTGTRPGTLSANSQMAKFNYRGADEDDINGLVDRDENMENELRTIVMGYFQKLFCQLALVKKVIQDFDRVYAPSQTQKATD